MSNDRSIIFCSLTGGVGGGFLSTRLVIYLTSSKYSRPNLLGLSLLLLIIIYSPFLFFTILSWSCLFFNYYISFWNYERFSSSILGLCSIWAFLLYIIIFIICFCFSALRSRGDFYAKLFVNTFDLYNLFNCYRIYSYTSPYIFLS